ncbi:MAG TPA: APC family permease [Candidatus Acidoferrales bacterium]|nr:APC family permease [Candidatus Acidoferrales bacterium]
MKQLVVGRALETAALPEQHLSKKSALAVLASDNLSSTAYATEEILLALSIGAAAGIMVPIYYAIPIAGAIVILTAIVTISYGQTLHAYPTGGGAYTVAKENLGVTAALAGAAALLLDYILTVAVSVAAGIAAITSAFPSLYSHRVGLCVLSVVVILMVNLRGVRESAAVFAGPVYFFILCMVVLIGGGLMRYLMGDVVPPPTPPPSQEVWSVAYVFLLLRGFAAGCVALTGVEAVANGVRIFRPPVSRNASITLYIMAGLLATMFLGTSFLAYTFNFAHRPEETLLSQLGRAIFGVGPIYYAIQAATMAILILAANTSFADFPRLSSIVAQDRFLPRQLANLGDRLVFSNGMLFLALVAILLLVVFGGSVHALIPLYMVGVFLAFTLSQAGMVVHWRKSSEPGAGWRAAVNAVGAVTTGLVLVVVAVVKFKEGAWMVVIALAALMFMFRRIRNHYFVVTRELSLTDYQKPEELRHTAVVPVAGINKMVLAAIEYARSISKDVVAVHVNRDGEHPEELHSQWHSWAPDVPLIILESPYRSIRGPLLRFIDEVRSWRDEDVVTVVIPEFVSNRWWHHFLHNQTTAFLKVALLFKPHIVVTSVPHHLRR